MHSVDQNTGKPIIEIRDLDFAYDDQPVLTGVNMTITDGDFVAMIGPNGGGKTTLLKLMLGLLKPRHGRIRVMGKPAGRASHRIGYVPQNVHINQHFPITALDVVRTGKLAPGKRWSRSSRKDRRDAIFAMEQIGMADYADRRMGDLSGGQRQRVFIARAMVTQPRLLLMDEPTASIDSRGQTSFFQLLQQLNRDVTIVVVSHDLLAISTYIKSVACVNQRLHYHQHSEINGHMIETMYPCVDEETCPIELVTHGHVPHRVLKHHEE